VEGQRCYQALELPLDAERFVADLQAEMHEAMSTLDAGLKKNPAVRLTTKKGRSWITLTPLDAQPDPPNLSALKAELNATWPMTSLLDMVKEADLRLGFTEVLKSPTAYETLERAVLRPRLLLCLHGMGTNAGLQRMASLDSGTTPKDLAYVRRRYLNVEAMRRAIAIIADGTLHARNPVIWGDGTTACASDSKHFAAWDQNLTTQWHVRYGGRGVMIYWHVERKSLCIHSQLKSPSSSEVASMIEGVLHHCTEMEVDRQYVDSHGQSTVAFAFCRLLGFELLPRLKGLNVVEQWNGATDFVFFARRGEMVSNRREDHEISMLALHLIQNCMVYINTLMIQAVLAKPLWRGRLTPRDYAALTPLIWEHVNPYGRFELDMSTRLALP
jgi:TnpA family transposase